MSRRQDEAIPESTGAFMFFLKFVLCFTLSFYVGSSRTSIAAPVRLCFSRFLVCSSFSVSCVMVMRPLLFILA
jgi:hypothetical protein